MRRPRRRPPGNADTLTIRALDPWGNVATGYFGDKTLTFSGAASSPAPATAPTVTDKNAVARAFGTSETITFTNGVATATLKLFKAETASVIVSDGTFSNGAGLSFTTAADTPNKLAITLNGGSSPTAGVAFPVVLDAQDAYGNASNVSASTGVTLSLNTGTGTLGGTLSGSIAAGQSQATITGVTYSKAEAGVKVTATRTGGDTLSPVTSPAFTVSALADRLVITAINGGSNPTAGSGFSVSVQAQDALGNPGNVSASTNLTLSLNTGTGTLGGTLTGTISAGSGSTTISGVTYTKAESGVKLTATRTSGDNLLASTSSAFTVDPGSATRFAIVGAGTQTAGSPNALTITAYDASGNVATGYTGDHGVTFSGASSIGTNDPTVTDKTGAAQAFATSTTLTFTNGVSTAGGSLVLRKVESALIVATAGSVTTTGSDRLAVSVSPAATDHLTVTAGAAQTAGGTFNTVVTAKDQFGNVTPAYTGTVHFTSTDGSAGLPANYTFVAGDSGSHTFSTSLATAGAQTITAADGSITGTTGTITVSPAAADHFAVSSNAGAPQTAGVSFSTTVVAKDAFNNTTPAYTGTVTLTSSDGQAVLPSSYSYLAGDAGSHVFTTTLKTAGSKTITATDSSITGNTTVSVGPASAASFSVTAASPQTAGTSFQATVTARDAFGNVATGYTGTATATSSDGAATLPSPYAFQAGDLGVKSLSVTLQTAGSRTVTFTDGSITGNASVTVDPATLDHFAVSTTAGAPQTAGASFTTTVVAKDVFGNTITGYTGTVTLASNDPQAVLPVPTAFVAGDLGSKTFTTTLKTAGSKTITATDASITGSAGVTVDPASAATLQLVSTAGSPQTAGGAFDVTVTAKDAFGNVATGYTGGVHFTSTDGQATLPIDYTFVGGDLGTHSFTAGVALETAGSRTVTATDTVLPGITGTTSAVTVVPAATTHFAVTTTAANPQTAGVGFTTTAVAKDAYGNTTPTYTGTVALTTGDAQATLPSYAYTGSDNGTHTFSTTLETAGAQTITATEGSNTGSANVTVGPASAASFAVWVSGTQTAGSSFNATVTALDAFGNTATGYAGSVTLTSSDGQAVLPASYTFLAGDNGVHALPVTLKTAGSKSVTATDGPITGATTVTVDPSATTHFAVTTTAASQQTAGVGFTTTAVAKDAYGNTTPTYTGTVALTTGDAQATLPSYAYTGTDNGTHTFTTTLKTAGAQTITATEGSNTGSANVTVGPASAASFDVSTTAGSPQTAGGAISTTVTARDAFGNVATGYVGTAHLSSSDAQADLDPDHTFTAGNAGVFTFSGGVTFKTAGSRTVTATDTVSNGITGTSPAATVVAAAASTLDLTAATTTPVAGAADAVTVTAYDAFGNVATTYAGDHTLTFAGAGSSPSPATPPTVTDKTATAQPFFGGETLTFTNGVAKRDDEALQGRDRSGHASATAPYSNGAGRSFTTSAAAASKLAISSVNSGSTPTAGSGFPVVVASQDAYGNPSAPDPGDDGDADPRDRLGHARRHHLGLARRRRR